MFSLRNCFCVLVVVFITCQNSLALVGDTCSGSCNGEMVCLDSRCRCPQNAIEHPDKSKCLPATDFVGGGCELQAQCTRKLSDYAQCLDFKCSCKENAVVANNVCVKKRELGDRCSNNEECQHVQDANCRSGVCACNDQFVPHSTSTTKCLPVAVGFQSMCEEDIQCSQGLGDHALCRDARCQCSEGYHSFQAYQPQCLENKGLNEQCSPGECYLPMDGDQQNSACIEQICKCKEGSQASADEQRCSGSAGLQSLGLLTALWMVALGMTRNLL